MALALAQDSDDEVEDRSKVCFGYLRGNVVGIRYYRGRVNNNEMVSLRREPRNPYDCNAVRVDNVYGVQVRHIKREMARALAAVVDKNLASLEGVVPFGTTNKFSMPCDISFWGAAKDAVEVHGTMSRFGYPLKKIGKQNEMHFEYGQGSSRMKSTFTKISQDQMKNELDNLFDKLEVADKTSTAEPSEAIRSKLFPHQKQALAWMIARENNKALPPFWEQKSNKEYFNSATNFTATKKPESVCGGILADDMGLGKTLEIIALVLTNFNKGKPLVKVPKGYVEKVEAFEKGSSSLGGKKQRQVKPRRGKKNARKKPSRMMDEMSEGDTTDEECEAEPEVKATGKADPEYQPKEIPDVKKNSVQPRRSSRRRKPNVRYTYGDEITDEELSDEEKVPVKRSRKRSQKKGMTEIKNVEPCSAGNSSASVPEKLQEEVVDLTGEAHQNTGESASSAIDIDELVVPDPSPLVVPDPSPLVVPDPSPALPGLPEVKRQSASGPASTLVVCPLSVLSNWQDQFETHVYPGLVRVYTYYGSDRTKSAEELSQYDVVLTTYQTLSTEFSKGKSPLQETHWLRVVLDEGHVIRNPKSQMAMASHKLKAERRWVVTGTPIQNSMKDLWSIICFLRLDPFTDRQWWRRVMERPIGQGEKSALGRLQSLMQSIAMRRTKTQQVDGKPLIDLPSRDVFVQHIELSAEERKVYESFSQNGKATVGRYVNAGTVLNNYADVLAILTRLRQLCCHRKLCAAVESLLDVESHGSATPEELRQRLVASLVMVLNSGTDEECPVCLDSLVCPVITHCVHVFCRRCIEDVIRMVDGQARCPLCRGNIAVNQLVEVPPEKDTDQVDSNDWFSSAKVDALMMALSTLRAKEPTTKCLVVSQFTALLTLIEKPLRDADFAFCRLDGQMSQKKRAETIEAFSSKSESSPKIMLLSLRAGGVGINLTAASRIFLMDPAWNPAAEDQCFDRCHRLGQTKPVVVTKFIVKDSVEERILELQKRKRTLMSGAFNTKMSAEEKRKNRVADLMTLLDL